MLTCPFPLSALFISCYVFKRETVEYSQVRNLHLDNIVGIIRIMNTI